ncbi:hypothetical protein ACLM5J_08885 [Nocardioides sp. Bht2]|uniref:hypothetical protein n=1 Tax=Nocardioides sp. Bht2 TaxID=3392297 RepID=UPI0039B42171
MNASRLVLPAASVLVLGLTAALPPAQAIDVTVPRVAPQTTDVDFTHAAFLDANGKVWARGSQSNGALGDGATSGAALEPVPAPLPAGITATKIDVGDNTTVVLGNDGQVYGTGKNDAGQLTGAGDRSALGVFSWAAGVTPQTVVDVGTSTVGPSPTTYAIGQDGTLFYTGVSPLPGGPTVAALQPFGIQLPAGSGKPAQVVVGTNLVLVITATHRLYGLSTNVDARIGNGTAGVWNRLDATADVSTAIAGANHTAWLSLSGTIYSIGSDAVGQFGDGPGDSSSATPVAAPGTWTALAGSTCDCTIAISSGTVQVAGRQPSGYADTNPSFTVIATTATDAAVELGGSESTFTVRQSSGEVWGAGRNTFVQLSNVAGSYSGTLVPLNDQPVVATSSITPAAQPAVGVELISGSAGWVPNSASVSTQWYRGSVGAANLLATAPSFTPSAELAGEQLILLVTGSGPNLVGASVQSELGTVSPGTLGAVTAPLVTGTVRVSGTLSATTGATTPASSVGYQWLRDGVAIPGATTAGYRLSTADAGRSVTVRASFSTPGYQSVDGVSTARRIPAINTAEPKLSGTPKVGRKLRAGKGSWSGYRYAYTALWYRNGKAISAGPSWTYKLRAKDRGKAITVRVVAKRTGWPTVTATSAAKKVRR